MDIEQLKLVLEMVGTATEGAMWFAFAWLAKGVLVNVLVLSVVAYAVARVTNLIRDGIHHGSVLRDMRAIDPAVMSKHGELERGELNCIVKTHSRGCEAIKAERDGQ